MIYLSLSTHGAEHFRLDGVKIRALSEWLGEVAGGILAFNTGGRGCWRDRFFGINRPCASQRLGACTDGQGTPELATGPCCLVRQLRPHETPRLFADAAVQTTLGGDMLARCFDCTPAAERVMLAVRSFSTATTPKRRTKSVVRTKPSLAPDAGAFSPVITPLMYLSSSTFTQ